MEPEEHPIHQRISDLINQLAAGNKSAFARHIGVQSGTIGDILGKRKVKPGFDILTKILEGYPDVHAEWLLLGKIPMLKSAANEAGEEASNAANEEGRAPYGNNVRVLAVQVDKSNNENIGLVDTRAAAGYVAGGFMEREFIRKLPSFSLPDSAYRNATFRAFQVSGDSMQSTLYDRDWVICRFVERWDRDIRDGYVHVVVTDDSLLVKRLQNRLTDRGELTLHSDNPAFPVQFLDGAAVREVWVAVAKLSRQFINPRYDVNQELMRTRADVDELLAFMTEMKNNSLRKNP